MYRRTTFRTKNIEKSHGVSTLIVDLKLDSEINLFLCSSIYGAVQRRLKNLQVLEALLWNLRIKCRNPFRANFLRPNLPTWFFLFPKLTWLAKLALWSFQVILLSKITWKIVLQILKLYEKSLRSTNCVPL